jgi:hypothetical protein
VWDLKAYYRQFHLPSSTWTSHQRVWVQDEGPSIVVDQAMMFGDRPASNWAMRFSGFIAYMVAKVSNDFAPVSDAVRQAFQLIRWMDEQNPDGQQTELIHSFVTCFIDDFGM